MPLCNSSIRKSEYGKAGFVLHFLSNNKERALNLFPSSKYSREERYGFCFHLSHHSKSKLDSLRFHFLYEINNRVKSVMSSAGILYLNVFSKDSLGYFIITMSVQQFHSLLAGLGHFSFKI